MSVFCKLCKYTQIYKKKNNVLYLFLYNLLISFLSNDKIISLIGECYPVWEIYLPFCRKVTQIHVAGARVSNSDPK